MKYRSIKYLTITVAALGAQTALADNVAERNIAAIFQPMLNVASTESDRSTSAAEAVSLLDGIVLDWRDPSRKAQEPRRTTPPSVAATGNVALESLREVYAASPAN
jgi:hypothetical protein